MTKILIIISGEFFGTEHVECIKILDNYMKQNGTIEYCGIASHDHFSVFEDIIQFKYKMINNKKQLSKLCDFISEYKEKLDYDWYIKFRPDMKLLENISFDLLSTDAINSRARYYRGPKKIKYGKSVGGEGPWKNRGNDLAADVEDTDEEYICLDDGVFIFHKNIIETCAFDTLPITDWSVSEAETFHRNWFVHRGIKMNVIGINLCNTKYGQYSGDINL